MSKYGYIYSQARDLQDRFFRPKQVEESPSCGTEALRTATQTWKRVNEPFENGQIFQYCAAGLMI